MKLVQILARELEKWPEGSSIIVQDDDGEIKGDYQKTPTLSASVNVWLRHGAAEFTAKTEVASDRKTAIVTREMWQAERERIAKPGKKACADGWIRHRGGRCPVDPAEIVEVGMRSGEKSHKYDAEALRWSHIGSLGDIMAYRIHKPAEQPVENKSKPLDEPLIEFEQMKEGMVVRFSQYTTSRHRHWGFKEGEKYTVKVYGGNVGPVSPKGQVPMCNWGFEFLLVSSAQDCCDLNGAQKPEIVTDADGPHQWRDRIREIDRAVEALEEERVSLIQRLEGEGLQLLQGKVCGSGQDDNCLPHGISWGDAPAWANVLLDAGSGYSSRYSWAESYSSGARRKFCEGGKLEIEIADHTIFRVISLRPSA